MRRLLWCLILSCLGVAIVQAQPDATWSMRLYDFESGTLTLQSPSATLDSLTLPTPANYVQEVRFSWGISIAPTGGFAAYSVVGLDDVGNRRVALIVVDLATGAVVLQHEPTPLPSDDVFTFAGGHSLFNDTGTAVAYSYISISDQGVGRLTLLVFDIATGSILFQLDSDTPSLQAALAQAPSLFILPIIKQYQGARIDFTLVPWGTEGLPLNESLRWDVLTGRVTPTSAFPNPISRPLPATGAALHVVPDDRLPAGTYAPNQDRASALPPNNTVHIYQPTLEGRFPFVSSPTLDFISAWFVEGGSRALLRAFDLNTGTSGVRWWLADRDGTLIASPAFDPHWNVIATLADGFAYTSAPDGGQVELVIVTTRDNQLREQRIPLQSAAVPVWVSEATPVDAAALEWTQAAPPIFPEIATAPPTPTPQGVSPSDLLAATPIGTGVLTVDGVAIINTTENDRLNMRNQAGLAGGVIARLDAGTRVTILEGPVALDGFVWWRVRIPTGIDGWVVESADGVTTLVPQN